MPIIFKPQNFLSMKLNDFTVYMTGRVATQPGNQGKQGKWPKQIPCREKSGNFKI